MTIRPYVQYDHEIFKQETQSVDRASIDSPEILAIMQDLIDTHFQNPHRIGVGLHAKQIGANYNIFLTYVSKERANKEGVKATPIEFWVVDTLEPTSEKLIEGNEGNFSIPGKIAMNVPRPETILVKGYKISVELDATRKIKQVNVHNDEFEFSGFFARLMWHEFDQTNNKFCFDYIGGIENMQAMDATNDPRTDESVAESKITIRHIGDEILHRIPLAYDPTIHETLVLEQLEIMHQEQKKGGVGISANQCNEIEKPLQLVIIGNSEKAGRAVIQQQTPGREVPEEIILLNPCVIKKERPYYPVKGERCLSIQALLRGKVERYDEITVRYMTLDGEEHVEIFTGLLAHIIMHEMGHMQGKTYLEEIIAELTHEQTTQFLTCVEFALKEPIDKAKYSLPSDDVVFDRDPDTQVVIIRDLDTLKFNLQFADRAILLGIRGALTAVLQNKAQVSACSATSYQPASDKASAVSTNLNTLLALVL